MLMVLILDTVKTCDRLKPFLKEMSRKERFLQRPAGHPILGSTVVLPCETTKPDVLLIPSVVLKRSSDCETDRCLYIVTVSFHDLPTPLEKCWGVESCRFSLRKVSWA